MRELMKKKRAELQMQRLENQMSIKKMTAAKLDEIAKKHGVILAVDDSLQEEVEAIRRKYDIPKGRVFTEQMTEEKVLDSRKRVDVERLGLLAYQRVMLEKSEHGGIMSLADVFEMVNTGVLHGNLQIDQVEKAMQVLIKKKIISDISRTETGVPIISFFPVRYTQDQAAVLNIVPETGVLTTAEAIQRLGWSPDRVSRALDNLEETGVARVTETFRTGKQYFFLGLKKTA
jgi:hypothetical protein